ncbi:hypothetical protein DAPK24_038640 [Pichia kluyveri]|uniref:Required for respiratory growth protein 8, mitochondrial n=1 Tax=Pichia kluyveri TaxID=36015 RepID=A0AAV5R6U1_PICKL|nr:hypothetical protein DAPK24_038640 [Pichia kluyveri]
MIRNTIRYSSNVRDLTKTVPLRLLGFPKKLDIERLNKLNKNKSQIITNYQLSNEDRNKIIDFLNETISEYPLNIILSNKNNVFGFSVKEMDDEVRKINRYGDVNSDVNEIEKIIDYKVIDEELNPMLFNIFKDYYNVINLDKIIEDGIEIKYRKIMIISITEKFMNNNKEFLKSLKEKYYNIKINACILNPHIFPFLKNISKVKEDISSENLYNIARYGLVKVNQHNNGSLILTKKTI